MVTITDQSFSGNFDPGAPPPLPATVTVIQLVLNDANDDGVIDAQGDIVNGSAVQSVYNGDQILINGVWITGATIYTADGGRYFTPTDDTVLVDSVITEVTFVPDSTLLTLADFGPACLTTGTLVETSKGQVPVENLCVGDLILTKDREYQPVKWVGSSCVSGNGKFALICFAKGSIGNDADLRVSPEHRMLISGWRCQLLFGQEEVLCAAKHLVDHSDDIYVSPCEEVTYFHLMFDDHEIIYADCAETESFYLGCQAAKSDRETFLEICTLFPELVDEFKLQPAQPARQFLKKYEAAALLAL